MPREPDDEVDITFRDMSLDEAASELVREMRFDTGMMVMPPEFSDYTEKAGKRVETIDCMVMHITGVDDEVRTFTFTRDDVKEMVMHFISWINDLHDAGRCDCGEHE